jgi:hypothetical protein
MKTQTQLLRKTALAAAVTLLVGGVASLDGDMGVGAGMPSLISTASAARGDGAGGGQGAMGAGRGGEGAGSQGQRGGGQGQRGGKSVADVLADEADDDSDRPDWAGMPGGEGRPGGGGNPNPGVTKGDDYGDLVMLLRDQVTGEPELDAEGNLQVCTSADCSTYVSMTADGEIPEGTTTFEVDFGRASVARSPANVIEHSLDEAITKLTADGAVLGVDPAGRITITVDGVTSTIDSPLENLALYIDLMQGLASDAVSPTEAALLDSGLANLDTAASLLAGVADKTGDITLDFVVYENVISGVVDSGDFYNFAGFDYDRTYDNVSYYYTLDGTTVLSAELNVNDYLLAINGALPADDQDAAQFTAAADDALEVIELVHTQIHDLTESGELLPGTVLP